MPGIEPISDSIALQISADLLSAQLLVNKSHAQAYSDHPICNFEIPMCFLREPKHYLVPEPDNSVLMALFTPEKRLKKLGWA